MSNTVNVTVAAAPPPVAVTVDDTAGNPVTLTVATEPAVTVDVGGATGPPGLPGAGVQTFPFLTPAATWTVPHNLARRPQVQLVDDTGAGFDGDVEYPDLNTVAITHAQPTAGYALIA